MQPTAIESDAALDAALAAPKFLLFKHSHRCGVSTRAFEQFERYLAEHPDTPAGFINVVTHRALSDRVAEQTGVVHESPQAILLQEGQALWSASHFDIQAASLREAIQS